MPTSKFATGDAVILDPRRFAQHATLSRPACHPALQPWIEHYWSVQWSLPGGTSYRSSVVPVAQTNLTVESGSVRRDGAPAPGVFVTGVVSRRRFDVTLSGVGGVVGAKFRAGAPTVITGVEARRLRDQVVPATRLFSAADELADLQPSTSDWVGRLDAFLLELVPDDDTQLQSISAVVAALEDAAATMSAGELADRCGMGLRSLQRLCRHYIGVGPQWLVARARVHAAIARLNAGDYDTLAALAIELGWFDQAHMGRDFTALVGEPPGSYRDRAGRAAD